MRLSLLLLAFTAALAVAAPANEKPQPTSPSLPRANQVPSAASPTPAASPSPRPADGSAFKDIQEFDPLFNVETSNDAGAQVVPVSQATPVNDGNRVINVTQEPPPTVGEVLAQANSEPWTPNLPLSRRPDYTLSREWDVNAPPQTRRFDWLVAAANQDPDGFGRTVISINGQTPGPILEGNEGDRIIIRVRNGFDHPITFHWHGLDMNRTLYADGVPGFTQCPIQPNDEFVYDFVLEKQFGTMWYHSHDGVQYTDGLSGALIIHSPRDPYRRGRDYDDELVLFATDWYHSRADLMAIAINTFDGFNGRSEAPPHQSVLVNGFGRFNCSVLPNPPLPDPLWCRTPPAWPVLEVQRGKRYRVRFINGGSHAQFRVSLDEHPLTLIGADATPIVSRPINVIPVHNGQRHDFIFEANRTGAYWLRTQVQTSCYAYVDQKAVNETLINVQVVDRPITSPSVRAARNDPPPSSTPFVDTFGPNCVDLPDSELVPHPDLGLTIPTVTNPAAVRKMHTALGLVSLAETNRTRSIFTVNNISQITFPYRPYARTIRDGARPDPATIAFVEWGDDLWAGDLIMQNDNAPGLTHPMHIHSRPFWVVARGRGSLSIDQWSSVAVNTQTAPLRDTVTLDGGEWAIFRFILDTPGIWALHCHIAWHLAKGFLGATIVHPGRIDASQWPEPNERLCQRAVDLGLNPNATSLP